MDPSPFPDRHPRPRRAPAVGLLRWLATMVLLLGLGGPVASFVGVEAVPAQPEAHVEVLTSPAAESANHSRRSPRTRRTTIANAHGPSPAAAPAPRVAMQTEQPSRAAPGVAVLPDPRGPPLLQLG